jgi:hypothetical protein
MLIPVSIRHRTITSHAVELTGLANTADDNDSHNLQPHAITPTHSPPAAGVSPAKDFRPRGWPTQPPTITVSTISGTTVPAMMASHVSLIEILFTTFIGLVIGSGFCFYGQRRSSKQWRLSGLFGRKAQWIPSSLPTLLPSWDVGSHVSGYKGRDWTNYGSISEGMVATEPTLGSEPRWISRAQLMAPRRRYGHRRPSRRYPEMSYHQPASRIIHRSPNLTSYRNTSRQEIEQAASLGKRTIARISGDLVRTYDLSSTEHWLYLMLTTIPGRGREESCVD